MPEWYRNSGARRANAATEAIWEPDFSDPLYLKHWNALIAAAGARYDGHPDLESVDISSVGYWGEGWSNFMPAFEHQKALIDIYFKAFHRTLLLMNFDEPDALAYGTSRGAGWRFDCLGDMRPKFSHMLDFYPQQIARTGIQDVWRRSPVVMETCGTPGSWKQSKWDVHYILSEALRWHVSSLNVKSTAIPPEWQQEFDDFQSKMGYRFALRRIEFEDRVKAGAMLPLKSWWVNEGVAPVYREYRLAFELTSPGHTARIADGGRCAQMAAGGRRVRRFARDSGGLAGGRLSTAHGSARPGHRQAGDSPGDYRPSRTAGIRAVVWARHD